MARGQGLSANQRQRLLAVGQAAGLRGVGGARHVAHRRPLFAHLEVNHRRDLSFLIEEDILGSEIAVDERHGALGPLAPRVDQPGKHNPARQIVSKLRTAENCNSS